MLFLKKPKIPSLTPLQAFIFLTWLTNRLLRLAFINHLRWTSYNGDCDSVDLRGVWKPAISSKFPTDAHAAGRRHFMSGEIVEVSMALALSIGTNKLIRNTDWVTSYISLCQQNCPTLNLAVIGTEQIEASETGSKNKCSTFSIVNAQICEYSSKKDKQQTHNHLHPNSGFCFLCPQIIQPDINTTRIIALPQIHNTTYC